jgi:enamine deaminase RidA (YjgF/YER057c/UK114 family)
LSAFTLSNPDGVHRGVTSYSLAAVVQAGARRIIVSGQVGTGPDGSTPDDAAAQVENAYNNLRTVLRAHGLGLSDIVKVTVFLTDRALLGPYREVRGRVMGAHAPASTLLFVSGLADPKYLVEIEAEAVG